MSGVNIFFRYWLKEVLVERNDRLILNGNDETVYLKHVENVIQEQKESSSACYLDQYKKTNNLDFFKNEKENFNYSGF